MSIDGKASRHVIKIKDVRFLDVHEQEVTNYKDIDVVRLHVRSSKTDAQARGVYLRLGRSGVDTLCPVNAAWSLLRFAAERNAHEEEPLCSWSHNTPVTCNDMAEFAKHAARLCQEDPGQFSTHSFRSGGATALFRGGASELAIQKFGRWASDTYKQYARIDDQTVLGLAPSMVANVRRTQVGQPPRLNPRLAGANTFVFCPFES